MIGPFAAMTHGRGAAFKRRLAFRASRRHALLVAHLGAKRFSWSISVERFSRRVHQPVALQPFCRMHGGAECSAQPPPARAESELAFSPLAFPTIVTPYGLAPLILLFTLYPLGSGGLWILAVAAFVLALDLLAMLCADLIAKIPFIKPGLDILGSVMGVLLVALGVQAVADGLRLLDVVTIVQNSERRRSEDHVRPFQRPGGDGRSSSGHHRFLRLSQPGTRRAISS